MKRTLLQLLAFVSVLVVKAQSLDLNQPLPVDNTVKKGVLPNGMTYYLHSTDVTKDVASYYIIQNVVKVAKTKHSSRKCRYPTSSLCKNGHEQYENFITASVEKSCFNFQ